MVPSLNPPASLSVSAWVVRLSPTHDMRLAGDCLQVWAGVKSKNTLMLFHMYYYYLKLVWCWKNVSQHVVSVLGSYAEANVNTGLSFIGTAAVRKS